MHFFNRIKTTVFWTGKIFAGLVLFLLFLSFLSYLLLLLPPVQNYALTLAERQLDSILVGDISFGRINTNLITQADIYDIVARDKSGRNDSISVGHIRVRFNLPALLSKTIHISSVLIENVNAYLSVTSEGKYIIPVWPKLSVSAEAQVTDSAQDSEWKIALGKVQLNRLNAVYIDSVLQFEGFVSEAYAWASFPSIDSVLVQLRVPEGHFKSPWWAGNVDTVSGSAMLEIDGMNINEIFFEGAGSQLRGRGRIPFQEFGNWDLSATIKSEMEPLLAIHSNIPGIQPVGQFYGEGSWKGTLQNPLLQFKGWGSGLEHEFMDADSLYLVAQYGGESTLNASLNLYSSVGMANVAINWQIHNLMLHPVLGQYSGDIVVDRIAIPKLKGLKIVPQRFPGQFAKIAAQFEGAGIERLPRSAALDALIRGGEFKDAPFSLRANLEGDNWSVNSNWEDNVLVAHGTYDAQGQISAQVDGDFMQVSHISEFLFGELVSGEVFLRADLNGLIDNLQVNAEMTGRDLSWLSARVDTLRFDVGYSNKDITVNYAYLSAFGPLDSVLEYFQIDSSGGIVKVVATASGPVTDLNISARVEGSNVFYKSNSVDSISGDLASSGVDSILWRDLKIHKAQIEVTSNGHLFFKDLQVNALASLRYYDSEKVWRDAGEINLEGQFGADALRGSFSLKNVQISSLSPWLLPQESYAGQISGSGSFAGPVENLRGEMTAQLVNAQFRDSRLSAIEYRVNLADSLISFNSDIFFLDKRPGLQLNGQVPLIMGDNWKIDMSGSRAAQAELKGNALELGGIAALLGADWNATGLLWVNIGVENQNGFWGLGGTLNVQDGVLGYEPRNIAVSGINLDLNFGGTVNSPSVQYALTTGTIAIAEGRVDSSFSRGVVGLDSLVLSTGRLSLPQNGLVELSGLIPFDNRDSILMGPNLALDFVIVNFPLVFLSPFLPENMIRAGKFRGDGKIRIQGGRPVLSGKIGMEGGVFELIDIEPRIGPIDAEMVMSGDSVMLKRFGGKWGDGSIKGSGLAVWNSSGISDLRINSRGSNLSFEVIDMAEVKVQRADLQLTNRRDGFLLSGRVDLGPTRVIRDLRVTDLVYERIPTEHDQYLQKLVFQINVNLLENLIVDMNLGYMEMNGEVGIAGTAFEPTYTGEIIIDEGYVLYLDRKFDIVEGSFYNYDPYKLNPIINLEAQTEVISVSVGTDDLQSYTIYMNLSGSLEQPNVQFRAEGEGGEGLSQTDIISILTLGQPLGAVGGDLGERLRAFAGESLLGFGSRKLEQLLGIERIDIRGDVFDFRSQQGPRLTLTKRLSSRLLLSYETVLGDLTRQRISAFFRLTRRFFLKGETDSEGESGLDLIFKLSR